MFLTKPKKHWFQLCLQSGSDALDFRIPIRIVGDRIQAPRPVDIGGGDLSGDANGFEVLYTSGLCSPGKFISVRKVTRGDEPTIQIDLSDCTDPSLEGIDIGFILPFSNSHPDSRELLQTAIENPDSMQVASVTQRPTR
jgi:hypothetical protein